MDESESADSAPVVRFKRRKLAHPRARLDTDATPIPLPDDLSSKASNSPRIATGDTESEVPNLKEILRNRKKPHNRVRDVARKVEQKSDALVIVDDASKPAAYSDRFVAQTGQVVGVEDKQM